MLSAKQKMNGFTLIELMIVVAIIGILASIAYPSYQDSVRKAHRGAAQADLVELSNFMERFFTENNQYHETNATPSVAVALPFNSNDNYNFTLPTKTAIAFTLQAAPKSGTSQASDSCGTLTFSSTGAKTPTTGGCW